MIEGLKKKKSGRQEEQAPDEDSLFKVILPLLTKNVEHSSCWIIKLKPCHLVEAKERWQSRTNKEISISRKVIIIMVEGLQLILNLPLASNAH